MPLAPVPSASGLGTRWSLADRGKVYLEVELLRSPSLSPSSEADSTTVAIREM
jgi:hypothetical protein